MSADRQLPGAFRGLVILVLRLALVLTLAGVGWLIYRQLPATAGVQQDHPTTNLQIVLHQDDAGPALDVQVSLYPVNVVAVRHEFFSEPRAGKRWDDFLKERMKGRAPINTRLDKQGHGSVLLAPGSWWLHAKISGDEEIEWRLPVTVIGAKQVIELTPQNAYTRSRTF
jgi:hypothetical protein